jgi:hypothetical protein
MDGSFRRLGSTIQRPTALLGPLQAFGRILNWLAGLVRLTEEEEKEAGIYLGGTRGD